MFFKEVFNVNYVYNIVLMPFTLFQFVGFQKQITSPSFLIAKTCGKSELIIGFNMHFFL